MALVSEGWGVAAGISGRLQPFVVEVTTVNERIMRMAMKHISLPTICTPIDMCEATEKDAFHGTLNPMVDRCFPRDTLIVFGEPQCHYRH